MGITSIDQIHWPTVIERMHRNVRAQLARGCPITYLDPEYPDEIVREHPDGRREIVDCDDEGNGFVVRAIEPRKDSD